MPLHDWTRVPSGLFHHFVEKTVQFLREGIHVLVVNLFPPTSRNPQGIHQSIWEEIGDEAFVLPPGKNRTLVFRRTGELPSSRGHSLRKD